MSDTAPAELPPDVPAAPSLAPAELTAALASPSTGGLPPATGVKPLLQQFQQALEAAFFAGLPAPAVVAARSAALDLLVGAIWRLFALDRSPHALLAVGGYGRAELHPCSDVDIALLTTDDATVAERRNFEGFIRYLWDIGLEVGNSVRSVSESAAAARADITIMTALLEARLLEGSQTLWLALSEALAPSRMWDSGEFFTAKLTEQEYRHGRYNDAFQQLEPNIKESPGGLRDIQVIAWVTRRHFHSRDLQDLVSEGFLSAAEYAALTRGRNHLWRIRCALHFLAGRRDDRLLFDHQKRVAELFGYTDAAHHRAVEQFMKDFYRTVRELSRLNEILLGLFQEAILHRDRAMRTSPLSRRFQIRGNFIEAVNENVFRRTPPALLEIFLLMQNNPAIKGVRASTIRLIREHLYLIDDKFRKDIRARSLFMEIIREPRRVGHELQRMHRYGVLSAYLPAFARIEGLMQFDLFHVYTVDEHLLFVVLQMRRFSYPITSEDQPYLLRQAIERVPKLELLYLAGLFHDIAKGRGGDHSQAGADEAAAFCRLHGLSEYDTNLVAWLVGNHLVMSNVAQRKDINDPAVIQEFSALVGDQIHLDYLFLLTIADIRGTNPRLWTSWMQSLLSELYLLTLRRLRGSGQNSVDRARRLEDTRVEARQYLDAQRFPEHAVSLLWSTLGEEYFLRHRPAEIAWHTETILGADTDDLPLVAVRNFEQRGGTSIFIYAHNVDLLFAISTAALDRLRLDVQDARIITSEADYTLDTFNVLDAETRSPVTDPMRLQEICTRLRSAIRAGEIPLARPGPAQRRLQHFRFKPSVEFSPDTLHDRTVMEVIAPDQPGFLSVVGRALRDCGVRVHDARIATIGERAEDYFYITDLGDRPVDDEQTRAALRSSIVSGLSA